MTDVDGQRAPVSIIENNSCYYSCSAVRRLSEGAQAGRHAVRERAEQGSGLRHNLTRQTLMVVVTTSSGGRDAGVEP